MERINPKFVKMKKVFFYLLIGSMLTISGCSKDEIVELPDHNSSTQFIADQSIYKEGGQRLQSLYYVISHWYYDPNCHCMVPVYIYMGCHWPSRNCLMEVTIYAYKSSQEDLSSYVDEFIEHYLSSSLPEYFNNSENYKIIFPDIDSIPNVVDEIIAGEILFHKYFNAEFDSTDYYIGIPYDIDFDGNWEEWFGDVKVVLRIKDERE
jgi:hypothetical protein